MSLQCCEEHEANRKLGKRVPGGDQIWAAPEGCEGADEIDRLVFEAETALAKIGRQRAAMVFNVSPVSLAPLF